MREKTPFDRLSTVSPRGSIHVVVESPAGSRNKYKYDPKLGLFRLNRVLPYEASFPYDYGFAPGTRSGDDDPLDVVLIGDAPTFPGCVVRARPVGVLRARKEGAANDRLLAVPLVSRLYADTHDISDFSPGVLVSIERFFRTILNVEGGEHQLGGFESAQDAMQLIAKQIQRKKAAKSIRESAKRGAQAKKALASRSSHAGQSVQGVGRGESGGRWRRPPQAPPWPRAVPAAGRGGSWTTRALRFSSHGLPSAYDSAKVVRWSEGG